MLPTRFRPSTCYQRYVIQGRCRNDESIERHSGIRPPLGPLIPGTSSRCPPTRGHSATVDRLSGFGMVPGAFAHPTCDSSRSLALAALVFVAMLLLTGLHS